tara:strand:+ start:4798 stop:5115 length:318 start_codon:yes stop_codon:yes gene_type:complete
MYHIIVMLGQFQMAINDWRYSDEMMEYRSKMLQECIRWRGELTNKHYDFCDWVMSSGLYKRLLELEDNEEIFTSELSALYLEYYYETTINKEGSKEYYYTSDETP